MAADAFNPRLGGKGRETSLKRPSESWLSYHVGSRDWTQTAKLGWPPLLTGSSHCPVSFILKGFLFEYCKMGKNGLQKVRVERRLDVALGQGTYIIP